MNAIVVVDQNWGIGREGGLLFSLPTDMKHFKSLTLNGTVLMGHRTLTSFPDGKPLSERRNIVISRDHSLQVEGAEIAESPEAAVAMTQGEDPGKVWVIGGGSVYTALIGRCKRVFLTQVEAEAEEPDTYFPNLNKLKGWELENRGEPITENGVTYRFLEYVNRNI